MSYTTYQSSRVAYQYINRAATTVVLLHGFCEDSTMWAEFMPLLSKKYSILTIDLAGFGDSDLLATSSIATMASSVKAVLEALAIQKCVLIGHSMGGYVALEFAAQYPDYLQGLGLLHSHPYPDTPSKIKNRKKTIQFVEKHGVAPFAGQFVRNLVAPAFAKRHPQVLEELIHHTATHRSDAVVSALQAMIDRKDHHHTLQQLQVPVLFVIGKKDAAIPYDWSLLQTNLANCASIHLLDQVGHLSTLEAPVQTAAIFNDFLDFCWSK